MLKFNLKFRSIFDIYIFVMGHNSPPKNNKKHLMLLR